MRTPTGLVAHSLLGGLTLLSAGAIALSLLTAPPVAQKQLQGAAKNTAAASSFVLTDVNRIRTPAPSAALGGKSSETGTVRILYQAPDRIRDEVHEGSGQTVTLVVIGDRRYEREGAGRWSVLPPSANVGVSNGAAAAQEVLLPLESLAAATSVVNDGSDYLFVSGNEMLLLENLFGEQEAAQLSAVKFSARLRGEFIGSEVVTADEGTVRYRIHFQISSVDSAHAVVAPSASQIANLP
jgi:hypothetical protein